MAEAPAPPTAVVLDIETTGFRRSIPIQIGYVVMPLVAGMPVVRQEEVLLRPPMGFRPPAIEEGAFEVHGIAPRFLEYGRDARKVLREIAALVCAADVVVAHNCDHDCKALLAGVQYYDLQDELAEFVAHLRRGRGGRGYRARAAAQAPRFFCTMLETIDFVALPSRSDPERPKRPALKELARKLLGEDGYDESAAHRALYDAQVAARAFKALVLTGAGRVYPPSDGYPIV